MPPIAYLPYSSPAPPPYRPLNPRLLLILLLTLPFSAADRLLTKLVGSLGILSPELAPVHQRLITLRRLLASIASRVRPQASETTSILVELRAIEDRRSVNGKFVVENEEGEEVEPEKGQELCAGLLGQSRPAELASDGRELIGRVKRTTLRSAKRSRRGTARRTSRGARCSQSPYRCRREGRARDAGS